MSIKPISISTILIFTGLIGLGYWALRLPSESINVDVSVAEPPPQVIVTSQSGQHIFTIEEVRLRKAAAEASIGRVIAAAKSYPDANENVLIRAESQLTLLQNNFAALSVDVMPDHAFKILQVDKCVGDAQPCFYFCVAEMSEGDDTLGAAWIPDLSFMLTSPHVAADNAYLSFLIEHELSHTVDTVMGQNAYAGNPTDPAVNTAVDGESQAYLFEGMLLDAATQGGYQKLVKASADAKLAKQITYFSLLPGPVTYVNIPDNFYSLLTPFGTVSAADQQLLGVTAMLDINRELITRTATDVVTGKQQQEWLYANFINGLHAAEVQAMIREKHQPFNR